MKLDKRLTALYTSTLLALFLTAAVAGCAGGSGKAGEEKEAPAVKPISVKTAAAVQGSVTPSLGLSGSVAGEREAVITAKTQGTLVMLGTGTGQRVNAGQVLAVLESTNQQITLEKSREQVAAAATALNKARADFERINQLHGQGAVSRSDYENADYLFKNAQAAYNAARSDSQLAGQSLKDATVTAPFAGSVAECPVQVGEIIFPGMRLLTLVDDSELKIKVNLTAGQLKLVEVGQKGVFTADAHPGREFACTVKSISSRANPANLTYSVELSLSGDPGGQLKSGMFGRVRLETAATPGIVIPREALITLDEAGAAELFLVSEGKAYKKKVKTGPSDQSNISISEGLKPGDRVVIFGQSLIREGSAVIEGE